MKLISFSLWGSNPKYTIGAIKNAELLEEIYPEWNCRFYCANCVPEEIITKLKKTSEVIRVNTDGSWKFTTERFKAIDEEGVEYVIFRDTDSRLNKREATAVSEWIKSGKTLHVMKDHPAHGGFPILAGMWGLKKTGVSFSMKDMLSLYKNKEQYHYDQIFLRDYIWRFYSADYLAHDEFFLKTSFPTKRIGKEYVGKPFNADDTPSIPADERFF